MNKRRKERREKGKLTIQMNSSFAFLGGKKKADFSIVFMQRWFLCSAMLLAVLEFCFDSFSPQQQREAVNLLQLFFLSS